MDLELNLVESCVKATDRDIFGSYIADIVVNAPLHLGSCSWLRKFLEFLS